MYLNKNQKIAFWATFIGFGVVATLAIYKQGVLDNLSVEGGLILATAYVVVAFFIHWFVKSNVATIEKWFQ